MISIILRFTFAKFGCVSFWLHFLPKYSPAISNGIQESFYNLPRLHH